MEGDRPCCIWGYSRSFTPKHEEVIRRFARPSAAGRPDETPPDGQEVVIDLGDGWQADRHRFSKWPGTVRFSGYMPYLISSPPALLTKHVSEIEFRRLDVQLNVKSRWQVHDGFLKKRLRGIVPDSGVAGDQFHELLAGIIAVDATM